MKKIYLFIMLALCAITGCEKLENNNFTLTNNREQYNHSFCFNSKTKINTYQTSFTDYIDNYFFQKSEFESINYLSYRYISSKKKYNFNGEDIYYSGEFNVNVRVNEEGVYLNFSINRIWVSNSKGEHISIDSIELFNEWKDKELDETAKIANDFLRYLNRYKF